MQLQVFETWNNIITISLFIKSNQIYKPNAKKLLCPSPRHWKRISEKKNNKPPLWNYQQFSLLKSKQKTSCIYDDNELAFSKVAVITKLVTLLKISYKQWVSSQVFIMSFATILSAFLEGWGVGGLQISITYLDYCLWIQSYSHL